MDFTKAAIAASINSWQTLKAGLLFGNYHRAALPWPVANIQSSPQEPRVERFQAAMDDDLNTSGALAVMFELAKKLQREGNRSAKRPDNSETLQRQMIFAISKRQWELRWLINQMEPFVGIGSESVR